MHQRLAHAGALPDTHISAPGCCSGFYFVNDWEAFVSVVQHEDGHETPRRHLTWGARAKRPSRLPLRPSVAAASVPMPKAPSTVRSTP
jgi:hypothetical protein